MIEKENNKLENEINQNNQNESNKQQTNNKKVIAIISAIVALIIVIVVIILVIKPGSIFSGKTPSDDDKPTMTPEEKQEYMDQLNSQEGMNLSQALYTYAIDIYNNKKYELLPKDENDVYYASKYDLELMNYDISLIPDTCKSETPIIYFDINKKLNESYEFEPIVYNVFCE